MSLPSRIRRFAQIGIIAQFLFLATWMIATLWQGDSYSSIHHSISDMYAYGAPYAWVVMSGLTIAGALTIACTLFVLWPRVRQFGKIGAAVTFLYGISVYGLGDLLAPFERLGCRLADTGCTSDLQLANRGGIFDAMMTTFGILVFIAASILVFVLLVQRLRRWKDAGIWMALTAVFAAPMGLAGLYPEYGGLLERVVAVTGAVMLMLLCWWVLHSDDV